MCLIHHKVLHYQLNKGATIAQQPTGTDQSLLNPFLNSGNYKGQSHVMNKENNDITFMAAQSVLHVALREMKCSFLGP